MEKTGSKLTELDDKALIKKALTENSQAAFSILHDRYKGGVTSFVSRFVGTPEEIEDICMVSFEKAFNQLDKYNPENRFSTWLFTIARNTALDHIDRSAARGKKVASADTVQDDSATVDIPDDVKNPEEEIIHSQDHEHLVSCIAALPDIYRTVAEMCFIDNLGYKEISEKADIPINTVKTRVSRAKVMLTRMMQDLEE